MSSFDDSLEYLNGFTNYEKKPPDLPPARAMGLERVEQLLEALGSPHKKLRCFHIAGTKGKGSTSVMLASILSAAGYKTGLYTSPHLVDIRERICMDGMPIPRDEFARMMDLTRPHLDRIMAEIAGLPPGAAARRPTYFEIMTHLAFLWFESSRADAAVLEVGMGGRLDATNVVKHPVACAITNVSMDHMSILGETLAEIASEKAGILKTGSPAVVAPQEADAEAAITSVAEEKGVALQWVGREILCRSSEDGAVSVKTPLASYEDLSIPLMGEHQHRNAAVAVALADLARAAGFDRIDRNAVSRGLASIKFPGRIQRIGDRPTTYIDGAHNPVSIGALTKTLHARHPGLNPVYVFGVAEDKDWRAMLRLMAPNASAITMTVSGNPRSVSPELLAGAAREIGFSSVSVEAAPATALEKAKACAGNDGLVVATGSLYLVGTILSATTTDDLRPY